MLGTYFKKYFEDKYDVLPVTRKDLDLSRSSEFEILDFLYKCDITSDDIIINAAGVIKQRDYHPMDMIKVNSIFPHILSSFRKIVGCKVIHISTDCVFSGLTNILHDEDTKHDCVDDYGKSKSLGEPFNLTTIRTSIIGEELQNKRSLLEWVISNEGNDIFGYDNHTWNGVTCLELCKLVQNMINWDIFWDGDRHFHSPNSVSKFTLTSIINEVYKLNINITPKDTEIPCFRILSSRSKSDLSITKSIRTQIEELKEFKINV
jgi:dTDP-4-dehydrorhamnose reductase